MPYSLDTSKSCAEDIRKKTARNPVLEEALRRKLAQILEEPHRFKPLRFPLNDTRRVHVLGSFVLVYKIDESAKAVRLLRFAHHDEAYEHKGLA